MSTGRTQSIARRVEKIFRDGTFTGLTDQEVLRRYVDDRDPAAFEALLGRHGGMVANVCRRILRDPDDAADAYQATFLALACRAESLRVAESLGPWLYRVATRIAARSRADRRRRAERERTGGPFPEPSASVIQPLESDEMSWIIHEELARLPERLQGPIVLCYLEGMTHEQAARQLGCAVGTVRSRLARARDRLRGRMTRRGLAPDEALAGLMSTEAGASAISPSIHVSLVKTAAHLAAGTASLRHGCGVPERVVALLEGVLRMFRWKQAAGAGAAFAMAGVVVTVAGMTVFAGSGSEGDEPTSRPIAVRVRPVEPTGRNSIVKTYYVGDLLLGPSRQKTVGDVAERRTVDMKPIIKLITSMVARGTWTVHDSSKASDVEVAGENARYTSILKRQVASKTPGTITPFFLTISLIVRQTPEVHDELANFLRLLRELIDSREKSSEEEANRVDGKPVEKGQLKAEKREKSNDRNARIRRLLDELRKEFEESPADRR